MYKVNCYYYYIYLTENEINKFHKDIKKNSIKISIQEFNKLKILIYNQYI
jgi:hypothetical protein